MGVLLLLPFLFVSVLPKGYMPDTSGDGFFTVTICTTDGLRTVLLNESGQEVPADENDNAPHGSLCIFSFLSAEVLGPLALPEWPISEFRSLPWRTLADLQVRTETAGVLGPRAPPIFA